MICKRGEKTALKDSEFALSRYAAEDDAWFRAEVREALDDLRPRGLAQKGEGSLCQTTERGAAQDKKHWELSPPNTSEDSIPHLKIEMWGTRHPANGHFLQVSKSCSIAHNALYGIMIP
jgi:hypothetical protein